MAAPWDLLLVALAVVHGAVLLTIPSAPLIAVGVWWNANTIAHHFIHRPFFRSPRLNLIFSAAQSLLTGIPQALWRDRHLAHHAGGVWRPRWTPQLLAETAMVSALWIVLVVRRPEFLFWSYLPGYLAGLALCALQGHYEHAGGTTSHYGRLYNVLCFNDGYHVEHHAFPGVHWRQLPGRADSRPRSASATATARSRRSLPAIEAAEGRSSRWPPLLRWLDAIGLDALERLVLRSSGLQWFVLRAHRQAFAALLRELPPVRRVAVVGGGLFPRTALLLRELAPAAQIVIIEADRRHADVARRFVSDGVIFEHAWFSVDDPWRDVDLVVVPLAFRGDRTAIYRRPPAPAVLVHDWLWRRRGRGWVISLALLKRLNLVQR